MVYLNNAATSFPKPEAVREAYRKAGDSLPPGQFRSTFENSDEDVFPTCRERLGRLLGTGNKDRIFFSSGATESLNALICGLRIKADDIITTVTEHNSVLRRIYPVIFEAIAQGYLRTQHVHGSADVALAYHREILDAIERGDANGASDATRRHILQAIADINRNVGGEN